MNKITAAVGAVLFGTMFSSLASAAEGGLSREFSDSDFAIVVPGKIDSFNRADVESSAFVDLLDKMTGDLLGQSISIDTATLDSYVKSIDSSENGLTVQFDKTKVLKFFQDRQIGVVIGELPDVLVWIDYPDDTGNILVLADEDTNGFVSALKERASFYGQSVYFPIMDADDIAIVTPEVVQNQDTFTIAQATARYGAKYIVVGTVGAQNGQDLDLNWQLYDVASAGAPIAQSSIRGTSFDLGKLLARNIYSQFAKNHLEKVHGIEGARAPAAGRVTLEGSSVGKNKAYVVIAGYMSYSDVISFENILGKLPGVKTALLYQTQADQVVYELNHTVDYKAVSEAILGIPGISLPDNSKPYNFIYDETAKNKAAEEKDKVSEVAGEDNSKVTDQNSPKDSSDQKLVENKQSSDNKNELSNNQQADPNQKNEKPSVQNSPNGSVEEEIIAVPIDPSSIKDTSDEKL